MIFGFFSHASIWTYIIFTLLMTHITVISVTIFLHRSQAHKALELNPVISHFFRFWLWLTTSIVTKEWVAIHRKHHSEVETDQDPHSPQIVGLNKVLFEGAELYHKAAQDKETLTRYGRGTPEDWLEKYVYSHKHLKSYGIAALFMVNTLLFGIPGIAIWAIQMAWIPFFAAGVVNGVGHYWGYRNFESPDASKNISPIGILMGGEELHNNHHTFATSARLSVRWFEFDIGWFYIRILLLLGLAKMDRAVPRLYLNKEKRNLDIDSLKAIVTHRFHVMDHYWRKVMLPVVRKESTLDKKGKKLLRTHAKLLSTHTERSNYDQEEILQNLLGKNVKLSTVYQFRSALVDFWHRNTENHAELLEMLQNWCRQAEASGIVALQKFAKQLHCYSLMGKQV